MDHNMAITLATVELVAVLLVLLLLPRKASFVDQSKTKDKESRGGTASETSSDKFQ